MTEKPISTPQDALAWGRARQDRLQELFNRFQARLTEINRLQNEWRALIEQARASAPDVDLYNRIVAAENRFNTAVAEAKREQSEIARLTAGNLKLSTLLVRTATEIEKVLNERGSGDG